MTAVDGFQRRHRVLGFPLAVVYKYFDDQGPYLASALTYYAFIAIFPLMLLGTSILGLVLRNEPEWQEAILDSALSFVRYDGGVDWDGEKVSFVVGIAGKGDEHLEILSRIALIFAEDEEVAKLKAATTPEELYGLLSAVNEA